MKEKLPVAKLILLFILDKMNIPITEDTLNDFVINNDIMSYIEFTLSFQSIKENNFIVNVNNKDTPLYTLTRDGETCIANFYNKIPLTMRENIQEIIKNERSIYKKNQEYFSNYSKNLDGSYTVHLKINAPAQPLLDLKLTIQERHQAKWIHKNWGNKAAQVYELIYDCLNEEFLS